MNQLLREATFKYEQLVRSRSADETRRLYKQAEAETETECWIGLMSLRYYKWITCLVPTSMDQRLPPDGRCLTNTKSWEPSTGSTMVLRSLKSGERSAGIDQ